MITDKSGLRLEPTPIPSPKISSAERGITRDPREPFGAWQRCSGGWDAGGHGTLAAGERRGAVLEHRRPG